MTAAMSVTGTQKKGIVMSYLDDRADVKGRVAVIVGGGGGLGSRLRDRSRRRRDATRPV